jgi:hypothetical protein
MIEDYPEIATRKHTAERHKSDVEQFRAKSLAESLIALRGNSRWNIEPSPAAGVG